MDIRVGGTAEIGSMGRKPVETGEPIEARLLSVRPARRRTEPAAGASRERRRKNDARDPRGGRVLILLVPDGHRLPPGLEQGSHRIFLRLARR
jgi:hypothetical protein